MTYSEGSTVWDTDGEIGKDGEEAIGEAGFESEIMGDFVNGEEKVLIGGCANDVCSEEKGPRDGVSVAEAIGGECL